MAPSIGMRDTYTAAKVGLLVVVGLALAFAVYRMVDERSAAEGGYTVWAVFDDAQGLVPKSRVLIAGIQVGYIDEIRLWGARARVDIRIERGVKLYPDAAVQKRSVSILGESILAIHPGTPAEATMGDGDRLAVATDAPGTDEILASVGATARSVELVARQLERAFGTDEGGRQMAGALRNLSEALDTVNRTISQNEEVVSTTLASVEETTTTAGPQLIRILDNVEVVTGDLRQLVAQNSDDINQTGGQITETVASINRAAHQLEAVLADVRDVTDRTARGEGTVGRLTNDETLIDEVEGVVEDVADFVGPMARLQTIIGLRSEYNFLANTFKNYVSLRIQPREDRYYLFELINDPRGLTEFTRTSVRRSPPADGEPSFYQETRVETRDAFRFSLMFAKRIHFATFRFGILESTGGLGIDLHLLDDSLEFTTDAFAVGEQSYPRLRTRLAYEVVQRFWILGGIDDVLNDSSDFFMGAMLRFNDEDLKSILPFVGGASAGGV